MKEGYVLTYEDELRLANNFAFLADVELKAEFISVAAIEQIGDPSCFIVRLMYNNAPENYVLYGLKNIFEIVQQSAADSEAGKCLQYRFLETVLTRPWLDVARPGEDYTSILFDEVVRLSQDSIRQRMGSLQWSQKGFESEQRRAPLYDRLRDWLDANRTWGFTQKETRSVKRLHEIIPLHTALSELCDMLKRADEDTKDQQLLLKFAILKSFEISS
jgi:hypothetical protein